MCFFTPKESGRIVLRTLVTLAALSTLPTVRLLAASPPDGILFESRDLKIFRARSARGTSVLVLTNLDDEGNFLAGPVGACEPPVASKACGAAVPGAGGAGAGGIGPTTDRGSGGPGEPAAGNTVKVVVNRNGHPEAPDEGNVEVKSDGAGGTTVIININPPPEPEPAAPAVSPMYPPLTVGTIVGAYRYPSHLPFLGYGLDTSSPSWFGGLGLNAGNGFGLSVGTPCGHGYDCMFGPTSKHHHGISPQPGGAPR